MSFGEYTSAQFYVVFIATIFSGESAASFFQYGTSKSACVSFLWARVTPPAKGGLTHYCRHYESASVVKLYLSTAETAPVIQRNSLWN